MALVPVKLNDQVVDLDPNIHDTPSRWSGGYSAVNVGRAFFIS